MNSELLWTWLVKGSVVLVAALLTSFAMRRSSAARRHLVWLASLGVLLVLPLAQTRLPAWEVSTERVAIVRPLIAPVALRPAPAVDGAGPTIAVPLAPVSTTKAESGFDWNSVLPGVWLGVCLLLLGWTGLGLVRVAMLVRSGVPWTVTATPARVFLCRGLRVPATAGVWRPVILLPLEATGWDELRMQVVIAHETAHIRRRDWLWQVLSGVACALYFFNPLIWIAAGKLRKESEFACDDLVLAQGIEPADYASQLLDIARGARFPLANTVGMARSTNVEDRLRSVIDGSRKRTAVSGRALVAVLGLALALAIPVAIIRAMPALQVRHSGRLPSIPWVQSEPIAPNVFLAKDGVAGLPNGIRVKLIGVAEDHGNSWGLDGETLPDGEMWQQGGVYWQSNPFHRWSHGHGPNPGLSAFGRSFMVEVQSDTGMEASTTSEIVSPPRATELQKMNAAYSGADDQVPVVELKAGDPAYALIDLGVASRADAATYRFGVAGTHWKTIAEVANPYKGSEEGIWQQNGTAVCVINLGPRPAVLWKEVKPGFHQEFLVGDRDQLAPDMARRALVFDRSGKMIPHTQDVSFDNMGYAYLHFDAATFSRIGKIVLQTSPFVWAEFRDVPLKPDFVKVEASRLDPGIRGTATGIAPGFSKKLSNGVTVSIDSVTRAVLDGGNWKYTGQPSWRADGLVLAKGPEIYEFPRPINPWGTNPVVHIEVGYHGAVDQANTTAEALEGSDPLFWLKDMLPRSQPGLATFDAAFLPSAKTTGVRVGVAAGPWKTIARQGLNIPDRSPLVGKDDGGRTGVEMNLGDQPTLHILGMGRTSPMVKNSIHGLARRFVAVLKTGEERPLTPCGLGEKSVEFYQIPARHGEFAEVYNRLLASQVKTILLQVRPYELVEFHGIALNPRR